MPLFVAPTYAVNVEDHLQNNENRGCRVRARHLCHAVHIKEVSLVRVLVVLPDGLQSAANQVVHELFNTMPT